MADVIQLAERDRRGDTEALKRDAATLGFYLLAEQGQFLLMREGQLNAVTRGSVAEIRAAIDRMMGSDDPMVRAGLA